ncbi:hypothetical protein [Paramagnetospirillum magneticum]|nr:hypothetical protein [Paramagnetospirillum magneticum]
MNVSLFLRPCRLPLLLAALMASPLAAQAEEACIKNHLAVATFEGNPSSGEGYQARCLLLKSGNAPLPFCAFANSKGTFVGRGDSGDPNKKTQSSQTILTDLPKGLKEATPSTYPAEAIACLTTVVGTDDQKAALAGFFTKASPLPEGLGIKSQTFDPIKLSRSDLAEFQSQIIKAVQTQPKDTDTKLVPPLDKEVRTFLAALGEETPGDDLVGAVKRITPNTETKWVRIPGERYDALAKVIVNPEGLAWAGSLLAELKEPGPISRLSTISAESIRLALREPERLKADAVLLPPLWLVIAGTLTALLIVAAGSGAAGWILRGTRTAKAAAADKSTESSLEDMARALDLRYPDDRHNLLFCVQRASEQARQWDKVRRELPSILDVPDIKDAEDLKYRVESRSRLVKSLAALAPGESGPYGQGAEARAETVLRTLKEKDEAVSKLAVTLKAVCPSFQMESWGVDTFSRTLDTLLAEADNATTLAVAASNIKTLRQNHLTALQRAELSARQLREAMARALALPVDASFEDIASATTGQCRVAEAAQNAFRSRDDLAPPPSVPEALRQLQQWSRELGGSDNLAALAELGRSRIRDLTGRIAAKDDALRTLEAAGHILAQLEDALGAGREQVVSAVARQKQDMAAMRARCDELEPKVERGLQAEELARAWDGFIRPVLSEQLGYSVPDLSSAAELNDFSALLGTEHPASRQLRLALVVANMNLSKALTAVREAGRDDVLAALGFQTITQDLGALFPDGIARDEAAVWAEQVGPGLNTGSMVRIFRAKALLAGYFAADPVFLPLRQLIDSFSTNLTDICRKVGCRITVPTILGPPQAGVDQHWDALPELRRLPEVRKRLEDALTRRETIVVDIHNIGVASPTDTVRPGVVMLNPADW